MIALLGLIPLRAWLLAGLFAAGAATAAYFLHAAYKRGETAAIATVERVNNANEDTANKTMDAIERCYATGGDWIREQRVCVHASPGQ
jgi:hypothetical protein